MEKQDNLKNELVDFEGYQKGLKKTLEEIGQDVDIQVNKELIEIKNLKGREENLISILPKNFQDTFILTSKKLKSNSLAYIEQGKCGGCKMSVPSMICQEVEGQTVLELCPSCGRILLPHLT